MNRHLVETTASNLAQAHTHSDGQASVCSYPKCLCLNFFEYNLSMCFLFADLLPFSPNSQSFLPFERLKSLNWCIANGAKFLNDISNAQPETETSNSNLDEITPMVLVQVFFLATLLCA